MKYTEEETKFVKDVEEIFKSIDFGESSHAVIKLRADRLSIEVTVRPAIGDYADLGWVLLSKTQFWKLQTSLEAAGFATSDWEFHVNPVKLLFLVQAIVGGSD